MQEANYDAIVRAIVQFKFALTEQGINPPRSFFFEPSSYARLIGCAAKEEGIDDQAMHNRIHMSGEKFTLGGSQINESWVTRKG